MKKRNIHFVRQKSIELIYDGFILDEGLRMDILLDDLIIVELKAHELYLPVWEAQLVSYLKPANKRTGFIPNLHVPLMKDDIERMIL